MREWPAPVLERALELRRSGLWPSQIVGVLSGEFERTPPASTVSSWTAHLVAEQLAARPLVPRSWRPPPGLPAVPCPELLVEALPGESQRDHARRIAQTRRLAIAGLRRWVVGHPDRLVALLLDPPVAVERLSLLEVILLGRGQRRSTSPALQEIGRRAVRDGINLLVSVGRASDRTRWWVAEHGTYGMQRRRGRAS